MSSLKQQYVKALIEMSADGSDFAKLTKKLHAVMEKRGHGRLLAAVLRATLRTLSSSAKRNSATLVVAEEKDAKRYHKEYKDAAVVVDKTIIGGYVFIDKSTRIDHSYKTKLLNWYRAVTR